MQAHSQPSIIVAGALAVDYSCDYAPLDSSATSSSPQLQTSNPARITQTLGGVAHNVARAAHYLGSNVRLCSAVCDDLSGRSALAQLAAENFDTRGIVTLPSVESNTAQYVAVNDLNRDLMVAMADMRILETLPVDEETLLPLTQAKPKIVVVDANWPSTSLNTWLTRAKELAATTAFEPVSVAKSIGLFSSWHPSDLRAFPNHLVDIATPNAFELAALHRHAQEKDFFSTPSWWSVIDSLGITSQGARAQFALATSPALVDQGIPQQSIQLLPFIPTLLTKLGPQGVLMTQLLHAEDPRLVDADAAPYILSRSKNGSKEVGGVYMRLFPPAEVLRDGEIVSVNGVGDTFLGTLVTGLVDGRRVEDCVMAAQKAAALTLRSAQSVNPELAHLGAKLW